MIHVLAFITAKPGRRADILAVFRDNMAAVQAEAGCLGYEPVVDAVQARRRALRHLVRRLFEGSPSLLVLNVLEDEEIGPAEREQLRKLIERA